MQAQTLGGIQIPEWTPEEWGGTTPYEWLYDKRGNKFLQMQLLEVMAAKAKAAGIGNFKTLWKAYLEMQKSVDGMPEGNATNFTGQPMELSCGRYQADDYGITINNGLGETLVCSHPIMPVRRIINIDSGVTMIELAFRRGKVWRKTIVPKQQISSAQKIVDLSEQGISVSSETARPLVAFLAYLEDANYDRLPESHSVGRLGWVDGYGFSPYVDNLLFDGGADFQRAFDAVKPHGSWESWKALALDVRTGNSIVARVMLAASFASVLVEPMDATPFICHAWGGSEAGKTVGLMLATSVWASPVAGDYLRSYNGTTVANEMQAAFCGSLPLCLDELQCVKDRKSFDDMVYKLCEGVGRARATKTGGLQQIKTWRNCTISTGEMPITGDKSGGGAMNRVIEMDCKDEKLFKNPREVLAIIRKNYGIAGKKFVDFFASESMVEHARTMQTAFMERLQECATDKQALAASIILTADSMAELLLFQDGHALTVDDIAPFLTTKEQMDVNKRALAWLCDFVVSNPARFEPGDYGYSGECWGCVEDEHAYIVKSVFDRAMKDAGFSPESFLSWAKRNNVIETAQNRTTKLKRLPKISVPARCVCLKISQAEDVTNSVVTDKAVLEQINCLFGTEEKPF